MTDAERAKRRRRLAAGVLLLSIGRTKRLVSDAARVEAGQASGEVAAAAPRGRSAALAPILASADRMAASLTAAIVSGRRAARQDAAARLAAELRSEGIDAANPDSLLAAAHLGRLGADEAEARVAAESLASQWRSSASHAALRAHRLGHDPGEAVRAATRRLDPAIKRTASTETARAYADEHDARLQDLVRSGAVDGALVQREWSAMLDACEHCWPHDGERVAVGESFSGGDEPGTMHPHCKCYATVVAA